MKWRIRDSSGTGSKPSPTFNPKELETRKLNQFKLPRLKSQKHKEVLEREYKWEFWGNSRDTTKKLQKKDVKGDLESLGKKTLSS